MPGHRIAQLSHADIERFVIGLEKLRAAFVQIAADYHARSGARRIVPYARLETFKFWQTSVVEMLAMKNTVMTVQRPVEALKGMAASAKTTLLARGTCCSACADEVVAYLTRSRAVLWASLPVVFGLA